MNQWPDRWAQQLGWAEVLIESETTLRHALHDSGDARTVLDRLNEENQWGLTPPERSLLILALRRHVLDHNGQSFADLESLKITLQETLRNITQAYLVESNQLKVNEPVYTQYAHPLEPRAVRYLSKHGVDILASGETGVYAALGIPRLSLYGNDVAVDILGKWREDTKFILAEVKARVYGNGGTVSHAIDQLHTSLEFLLYEKDNPNLAVDLLIVTHDPKAATKKKRSGRYTFHGMTAPIYDTKLKQSVTILGRPVFLLNLARPY